MTPLTAPIEHGNEQRQQDCRADRHPGFDQIERDRPCRGHDRNHAEVDAPADDDQPHSEPQNAENGDAAHQVEQILDGGEVRQRDAEDHQQRHREQQHDLFLRRFLQQLSKQTADSPTLTVSRCIQRHGNPPPRIYFSSFPGYRLILPSSCPDAAFVASPNRRHVLYMFGLAYLNRRAPSPRDDRKFAGLMTPGRASGTNRNQSATFAPLALATGPNGTTAHRSKRLFVSSLLPALSNFLIARHATSIAPATGQSRHPSDALAGCASLCGKVGHVVAKSKIEDFDCNDWLWL